MKFSNETCKRLGHYVYALVDPRDNHVFYIGQGVGNRVFEHVEHALNTKKVFKDDSEKVTIIKEIVLNNKSLVKHYILRHGLSKEMADELEATLIDLLHIENLGFKKIISNINRGKDYETRGAKSVEEIEERYAEPIKFDPNDRILCLNIAKSYNPNEPVYEAAKQAWNLNKCRREKITHILAVSNGIVRGVFSWTKWYDADDKTVGFIGDEIKDSRYLNKSIKGQVDLRRRPFRYVNV